jgi:hypothetical protein
MRASVKTKIVSLWADEGRWDETIPAGEVSDLLRSTIQLRAINCRGEFCPPGTAPATGAVFRALAENGLVADRTAISLTPGFNPVGRTVSTRQNRFQRFPTVSNAWLLS